MCTILFLHGAHAEFPLIVAANRDEFYARPSREPRLLSSGPRVLAGLDERAGGTWLGVNEHGIVVGLTNQRTHRPMDPALRSRGEVVSAALSACSVEEIEALLSETRPGQYNPFNLLFGRAGQLRVAYSRTEGARIETRPAPRGVHVLPNDRIGAPGFPKADRARCMAEAASEQPWSRFQVSLARILADHALPSIELVPEPPAFAERSRAELREAEAICLHGERYGTRSSTILALSGGGVAHYLYADGKPCQAEFRDYTHLLREGAA